MDRSDGFLRSNLFGSSGSKPESCSAIVLSRANCNWHGFPPHSGLQMSSATDHLNTDFATKCKKIPRYSGELTRQMADRLIAQHYFHGMLVHRVVKLSFSNKFSPINGSIRLDKHDIHAQLMRKWTFPCCVVTKLSFSASFSCAIFSFEFYRFHFICGLWQWRQLLSVIGNREIDLKTL